MKRIVLSSFGLLVGLMLVFSSFAPVLAQVEMKTISAKALTNHECDSTEWHFVITQVEPDQSAAPSSIHVTWSNGNSADVGLDKYTGKTAHYSTTANLDSTVTEATASIYSTWSGEFNLSHGPCGEPPVENKASLKIVNDCAGGHIEISANNGGTYPSLPSWTWTNPYALEAVPGGSVTVTWTSGTPLSMTLPYDTIYEPKECQTPLPHTYKVEIVNNCDGYEWKVTVDKGTFEADMPLFGKWIDKYTQEESPVPTISITWEDGYNEKVTLDKIIEPTNCVVVDEHKFVVTPKVNCDGYSWKIDVTNGKYEVIDGSLSGVWTDKHTQEKSPNPTVKLTWDDGYTKTIKLDTITEPANCVPEQPTPEPTPTPVPQETGAGNGLPWMFPVGLIVVGLSLAGIFWPKH